MIEKLNTNDTRPEVMIEKLNELIDAHNKLAEIFNAHFHEPQLGKPIIDSEALREQEI